MKRKRFTEEQIIGILSGRAAAEAGKYRTSRTPYMREIMENL
jgi:hypothetical protein